MRANTAGLASGTTTMNALVIVQAAAAVSLADAGGSTSDDLYGVATTKKSLALPTGSPDPVSRPSQ